MPEADYTTAITYPVFHPLSIITRYHRYRSGEPARILNGLIQLDNDKIIIKVARAGENGGSDHRRPIPRKYICSRCAQQTNRTHGGRRYPRFLTSEEAPLPRCVSDAVTLGSFLRADDILYFYSAPRAYAIKRRSHGGGSSKSGHDVAEQCRFNCARINLLNTD